MSKRSAPSGTPRKPLLNAAQRKHLAERVERQACRLRRNHWNEKNDKRPLPPEVIAAKEVIRKYEEGLEAEVSKWNKRINKLEAGMQRALLFDSAEEALRQVEDFEALTRAKILEDTPVTRKGRSPNWDKA